MVHVASNHQAILNTPCTMRKGHRQMPKATATQFPPTGSKSNPTWPYSARNDTQLCLGITSRSLSEIGHKYILGNNNSINTNDKRDARLQNSRNYFLYVLFERVYQRSPCNPSHSNTTHQHVGRTQNNYPTILFFSCRVFCGMGGGAVWSQSQQRLPNNTNYP